MREIEKAVAERGDRAQALFPDLSIIVHCLFSPLRSCNQPAATRHLPAHARLLRRRPAADPIVRLFSIHSLHKNAVPRLALPRFATIVAPVLGPTLGGFITDHFHWRWIFFVNLPVGLIAVFFVSILVEDPPWRQRVSRHVDFIGLSLITFGLGCMQVMLDRGEDEDWFGSPFIRVMAILATLGIFGAIGWLLIAKNPIVDLDVFKGQKLRNGKRLYRGHRRCSLLRRGGHPAVYPIDHRL
jgi:Major Facilitator Superfamily